MLNPINGNRSKNLKNIFPFFLHGAPLFSAIRVLPNLVEGEVYLLGRL
jgi:hypothetical protein